MLAGGPLPVSDVSLKGSTRHGTAALGIAALLLSACGGSEGSPAAGVIHLDLRLADGSSPSHALAAALEVREVRPKAEDPASLDAWELLNGVLGRAEAGARLTGIDGEVASLRLTEPIESNQFPRIELVMETRKRSATRLTWNGDKGPGELVIDIFPDASRASTITFNLADAPRWKGTIRDLTITPSTAPKSTTLIHALRLLPRGFEWGFEPLREEARGPVGERPGDAGLRLGGEEARRAWPSDEGVPLYALVENVPRAAVLSAAVAVGNRARIKGLSSLVAVVDARSPGGAWRRLVRSDLPAYVPAEGVRWHTFVGDLSEFAGSSVELRFLARRSSVEPPDEVRDNGTPPVQEHILWGAPEVLAEPPSSRRPNIVLITLDTTRADAMERSFTPFLDRFGQENVVFTDAWASSNATTPSHASILTGLHVEEHGAISNRHVLGPEILTLVEQLRDAGYHTAGAASVPHIEAGVGFGQGFDVFAPSTIGSEFDGRYAVGCVEDWLAEWEGLPARPFFLWVHLFDPHAPYAPPEPWVASFLEETGLTVPPRVAEPMTIPTFVNPRSLEELPPEKKWLAGVSSLEYSRFVYHLSVAYADHLCERLISQLERGGHMEETAVFVAADHGEALGEHGSWFEHSGLYRETLQVPLFMRLPDGPRGVRVEARVSNIDLAPTILRLCAVPDTIDLAGEDLVLAARGEADEDRVVWFAYSSVHQIGFRDSQSHFVTTLTDQLDYGVELIDDGDRRVRHRLGKIPLGTNFLYRWRSDPDLVHNLSDDHAEEAISAVERAAQWRSNLQTAKTRRRNLTAGEEANLQGLGYAGD